MHYIYYIHELNSKVLLYIGRSLNPEQRRKDFIRRTGIQVEPLGLCQRFSDFDKACAAELNAIANYWPPYNKRLVSVRGNLDHKTSDITKQLIGAMQLGKSPNEVTRKKLQASNVGQTRSAATKAKISAAAKADAPNRSARMLGNTHNIGRKHSVETKAKISRAQKGKIGKSPSAETRAKLSAANLGKVKTPESIEKMRTAALLRWQKHKVLSSFLSTSDSITCR